MVEKNKNVWLLNLIFVVTIFFNAMTFASVLSSDARYRQAVFSIQNRTHYALLITIYKADGTWAAPVAIKKAFILQAGLSYQNNLISLKGHDGFENFCSIEIAQLGNERENYLIFSESTNEKNHYLRAYIPDGLGDIFISSETNHCDHDTPQGYAYCKLVVKE